MVWERGFEPPSLISSRRQILSLMPVPFGYSPIFFNQGFFYLQDSNLLKIFYKKILLSKFLYCCKSLYLFYIYIISYFFIIFKYDFLAEGVRIELTSAVFGVEYKIRTCTPRLTRDLVLPLYEPDRDRGPNL